MPKEITVLTIDVGSDNLKMAEFVFPSGGGIMLRKFGVRKLEEKEGDSSAFSQVYHEMLTSYNFTAKQVRLSLSGQSSLPRLSKLPPLLGNKSAIAKIVEYEARQAIPYAMSEVVWDYQLIRHAWQDQRNETLEDGSTIEIAEDHEEYEALFVAVKNEQIVRYTDVIEDSGRSVISVEIAPVALFNAARATQCRENECTLILNIGGHGSSLILADENRVFLRPIPIGGDTITQQISKEFGMNYQDAEELKHRHGFVALGGAYEEPESEVAATISKIARNVMTRLHKEVMISINVWRSQHGGRQPARILLAGGGSTMPYITDFFQEKMRMPVEYLNTFGAITLADEVDKEGLQAVAPMFQELIGMSLRNVTRCPVNISLIPPSIRNQWELNKKKPYFYVSAAAILLCLAIFGFGINKRHEFDKQRVERVKIEVDKTNQMVRQVDGQMTQMRSAQSALEEAEGFLRDRNKWTSMLNELETRMPDSMWLIKLVGEGDVAVKEESSPGGGGMGFLDTPFAPGGGAGAGATAVVLETPPVQITEVKELRLVGYTLITDKNLLEREFQNRLKDSTFFDGGPEGSTLVKYTPETGSLNMTAFEMRVKLKTPIKK